MSTQMESYEEAKEELKVRIASLKKQTIFSLALALVCVFITIVLFNQLEQSNKTIAYTRDTLNIARDSLDKLSTKWRESLVDLNRKNDSLKEIILTYDNVKPSRVEKVDSKTVKIIIPIPSPPVPSAVISQDRRFDGYLVYIQDRDKSKMSPVFKKVLQQKGFTIPRIEHIGSAKAFANAVKYFHKEDKDIAYFIQSQLLEILEKHNLPATDRNLRVFYLANNKVPKGQLEVWIDK